MRPPSPRSTYSGGMRRRLDLAMTLVGEPRIIFLDEPTTGLDPRSRRVMWQIVRELVADGVTIFLTTQYLEEADQLAVADRAARRRPSRRPGHAGRAEAARARRQRPPRVRRRRRARSGGVDARRWRRPRRRRARAAGAERRQRPRAPDAARPARLGRRSRSRRCPSESADLDDVFLSLTGRSDGREADQSKVPTP